jgi:pimeloyl-[acyl-carrier protein] synthase
VDAPLQILTFPQGAHGKGVEDPPNALKYDFHDPAFYNNPYPYYRRMQQEDPLWHNPISGHWVVTRYHDVMEMLHSPQCSNYRLDELMKRVPDNRNDKSAPLHAALKDRLLFLEGEGHLRIRKLVMHAFASDLIQRQKPLVAEVVADVLDHLDPSSQVDLVANATNLIPGRVILHILGFPEEKQPEMKEWTDDVYAWLGTASGTIEGRTERAVIAVHRLTKTIRDEVTRVRQSPRADVLTALVKAEDEGHQLTDDELVANVIGLINAGQETTTCLLANGMLALFTHPEERDRLRAQPGLWETAIDEFLRYESPAQFVARRVESRITICGVTLDRGTFVSLGLGAANRDPAVFTDPDRLDIGRKEGRILAFGFGPHFCVGAALAHLEASVFFHEIEARYPKLELAVSPEEVQWRHTVSFRSPLTLPVVTR